MADATIAREGFLGMQVCVPKEWSDGEVETWVNQERPLNMSGGWTMCKEGDDQLAGDPERVPCHNCDENVHILLGC